MAAREVDGQRQEEVEGTRNKDDAWKKHDRWPALFYATPITRSICLMHSVKLHRLLLARHSFQTIRNHQPSSLSLSLSSLLRIFQCFLLFVASSPFLSRNVFPSTLCRGQVLLREKGTTSSLSLSLTGFE